MKSKRMHSEEQFYDPNWEAPATVYGDNLFKEITDTSETYAVMTMEIPWNLVKDEVAEPPRAVFFVNNMHQETVQALEKKVPPVDLVIGLGGGSSHDMAKYVAIRRQARLVQVPTILSSDACVTDAVGLREGGKVTYFGHSCADKIYLDFSLIRKAPRQLIQYGAADILSSHTALFDWKLASERGFEEFDEDYYQEAKGLLARLRERRHEIREVTDKGIRTIVELYISYARMANRLGTDRAQEGSEHFFAYNAEYATKRQYLHGELLAVGILAMSYLQRNEVEDIVALMEDFGCKPDLSRVGITQEELVEVLRTSKEFVKEGGYYYSIIDDAATDASTAGEISELMR